MAAIALSYLGAITIGEPLSQNAIFYVGGGGGGVYGSNRFALNCSGIALDVPNTISNLEFTKNSENYRFYTFMPDIIINHTLYHWINNIEPFFDYLYNRFNYF